MSCSRGVFFNLKKSLVPLLHLVDSSFLFRHVPIFIVGFLSCRLNSSFEPRSGRADNLETGMDLLHGGIYLVSPFFLAYIYSFPVSRQKVELILECALNGFGQTEPTIFIITILARPRCSVTTMLL